MKRWERKRGDDLPMQIEITVEGLENTVAGASAWFTVKVEKTDPYSAALVKKTVANGGITTEAPRTFRWNFTKAEQLAIGDEYLDTPLFWDFQYQGADGRTKTPDEGILTLTRDVTDA